MGHECEWKDEVSRIAAELERSKAEMDRAKSEIEALKRHIFGKKSEKMPPMALEVLRGKKPDPVQSQQTREKNAELKAATMTTVTVTVTVTETVTVEAPVPEPLRCCPKCGKNDLQQIASPKPTTIVDYVPGHFRRRIYNREKLVCACEKHVVTAPVPAKVFEKTQYGPGFMAYLAVTKTLDSMPLYRLEKSFQRLGMPISRSTMNTLYNRAGDALGIVARRILAQVAASDIVLADETTHRTQECGNRPYVWIFSPASPSRTVSARIEAVKPRSVSWVALRARWSLTRTLGTTRSPKWTAENERDASLMRVASFLIH